MENRCSQHLFSSVALNCHLRCGLILNVLLISNPSGNCQKMETCMVRACHMPRQPLQNHPSGHLGGYATPWSAEEMLDGQYQRVDIPACTRAAHKGFLQKRMEDDHRWIVSHVTPTTQSVNPLIWVTRLTRSLKNKIKTTAETVAHATFYQVLGAPTEVYVYISVGAPQSLSWRTLTNNFFVWLVGALSPVNHKGLHQGWQQTLSYLHVIHSTSHYATSFFFSNYNSNSIHNFGTQTQKNNKTCFGAYFYSAGT